MCWKLLKELTKQQLRTKIEPLKDAITTIHRDSTAERIRTNIRPAYILMAPEDDYAISGL